MSLLTSVYYYICYIVLTFVVVMFAYEQCLLCLSHHPDIWIEAALYLEQASKLLAEKGVCVNFFHSFQLFVLQYFDGHLNA